LYFIYLFIYLLSFGLLLHIKKNKKQKTKKQKTKNKNKKNKKQKNKKQNGQGSRYSLANYSSPLRYN